MTRPFRFLMPMAGFLLSVIVVSVILWPRLEAAFRSNLVINGVIVFVLLVGCLYILRQVARLKPDIDWIAAYEESPRKLPEDAPPLLASLSSLARSGPLALNPISLRSLADGIAARLDERRELARYLVALLVFLGLLGTFWGLLGTILAIGQTINGLNVDSTDVPAMFEGLKAGLQAPLSGMGTAFSSSLFGLAGSLILGFLDLQLGRAQSRFFNELEDWLAAHVIPLDISDGDLGGKASAAAPAAGPSAFMRTIMTQSADSLEAMERRMSRADQERDRLLQALAALQSTLSSLETRSEKQAEALLQLAAATQKAAGSGDDASLQVLKELRASVAGLADAQSAVRAQMSDDINAAATRLGRTIAAIMDERQEADAKPDKAP
ncbi:MAG: flagellar motor protein MotA [Pseudomonadota bacterium]